MIPDSTRAAARAPRGHDSRRTTAAIPIAILAGPERSGPVGGFLLLEDRPKGQPGRLVALVTFVMFLLAGIVACGSPLLTPSGRSAARLALILPEIMAPLPVRPSGLFAPPIATGQVTYEAAGGIGRATIWRPADGRYPGLVLSLGVNPAPADDPRVIRLGEGLARLGLVVMLLQSDALDHDIVEPAEIDRMVGAFEWLEAQPFAGPRVGMTGFSVGASLLTIAAADERIRDRVAVVNAFGGYGSLRRLALDTVSGSYVVGPREFPWEPDELTVSLIRKHLAERLEPDDRALLLEALPGAEPPRLPKPAFRTRAAERVWAFLTAPDRDRADEALSHLPVEMIETLDYLSPETHLDGIRAELYVMHDRNDKFVPASEALKVAAEARTLARVHLTEFDLFEHVDIGVDTNPLLLLRESLKLFWHVYRVVDDLR